MATIGIDIQRQQQWWRSTVNAVLMGTMFALGAAAGAADSVATPAGPDGPTQTAFVPATGQGPAIIVLAAGHIGPVPYQPYARTHSRASKAVLLI